MGWGGVTWKRVAEGKGAAGRGTWLDFAAPAYSLVPYQNVDLEALGSMWFSASEGTHLLLVYPLLVTFFCEEGSVVT